MNHEEEFNVEGYEQAFKNEPLFQDLDYQDQDPPPAGKPAANQHYEEQYEDDADLEEENFPEPAKAGEPKKDGSKMRMYVLGGIGALVVAFGGTYFMAPEVFGDMPGTIMSTLTGSDAPAEPAPDPVVAKPHAKKPPHAAGKPGDVAAKPADDAAPAPDPAKPRPHAGKPHKPAAVAAAVAAKPADEPKAADPEFKPAPKKPAKVAVVPPAPKAMAKPLPKKPVKPVPKAAVAAVAAGAKASAPSASTAVAFQRGSYWVSASEVERLWAFSSKMKGASGQFTVESWVGAEKDALNLSRKRANRVAELLTKNTPPNAYKITVKVHGTGAGKSAPGKVSVSYSDGSKL